ncbi:MAG: TRAP transporter large permease subunit [Syntrophales bacterium]|jgi:TRAP-type mannitol/chloroaromatic compound transport system permease large subunit|nr:TRAP transporter large permease subunit [Syntrophales bacterium]
MEFIANNFVPLLFVGLFCFLLTGFPVAFSLAATGLTFGFIGIQAGMFHNSLFQALPLRIFGIVQNETMLAIPFFTFMGLILERSGMAEDLLETVGQLFGPLRGGLAIATIFVGALLAATTGVMAAAVISMGLISLPIMLRYGYNNSVTAGVITASGTLAQIIPPSLVLIVMADQLGCSVGDMYAGAMVPGLLLVALFMLFIIILAIVRPRWVPALPKEARIYREENGASGYISLLVVLGIAIAAAFVWSYFHDSIINPLIGRTDKAPSDEIITLSVTVASLVAFVMAIANKLLRLHLLSKLSERVVFALLPPLVLIFLVLGTIFIGVATPTEGGAMGASGAMIMAFSRRKLNFALFKQALENTTILSCFVMFILIGATVFSFTFNAADGHLWVEHIFAQLPGGRLSFLIAVNILVFILGCFIDFFEIAFIVIPLLVGVATKLDINLVWFGVLIGMNLQTSFLSPPFGFALFYLRSVAPRNDYIDRITGKTVKAMTTPQIYKGSVLFIALQVIMVIVVLSFPQLVTGGLDKNKAVNLDSIKLEAEQGEYGEEQSAATLEAPSPEQADGQETSLAPESGAGGQKEEEDPMAAVMRALEKDKGKK